MKRALLLAIALGGLPASAQEPAREPADEEVLRIYAEQGEQALSDSQRKRLRFWIFYEKHRTALTKTHDGALLAEDFDEVAGELPDGWRLWDQDPAIRAGVKDGVLTIAGTSSRPGKTFNGIVSERFAETDVVAIVELGAGAPLGPGRHEAMLHLCGTDPDWFNELSLGRLGEESVWSHYHHGPGATDPFVLPARGDEHERFTALKLEHVAETESSRAWVRIDGEWRPVGDARRVVMSTAKVELKTKVQGAGMDVDYRFDHLRLYPRPETHPVRLVLYPSKMGSGNVSNLELALHLGADSEPTASGTTDRFGRVSLRLPPDRDYPVAARVILTVPGVGSWEGRIEQSGVSGLYPGDRWALRVNGRELAGDGGWWETTYAKRAD